MKRRRNTFLNLTSMPHSILKFRSSNLGRKLGLDPFPFFKNSTSAHRTEDNGDKGGSRLRLDSTVILRLLLSGKIIFFLPGAWSPGKTNAWRRPGRGDSLLRFNLYFVGQHDERNEPSDSDYRPALGLAHSNTALRPIRGWGRDEESPHHTLATRLPAQELIVSGRYKNFSSTSVSNFL